jgi:glycosyltransferase involved in cell wall biosynthesis
VKVSIGLPVYNGERFIKNAINSILSQTFTDFELIISDNASTDATQEICEEYANKDKRIKYIRQPTTVSMVDNFINVLHLAQADCFMWATHDDYYESENYIAALYDRMNEGYTFVFPNSNFMIADNEGHITYRKRNVFHGLHRTYGSKYEMSKDFVTVYGLYSYGMQIYGMFKTDRLRRMVNYLKLYSKYTIYYVEGSFLHKLFSCEKSSFVDTVCFNYVYHGKNATADIASPTLLFCYMYFTCQVVSIYLSSSFSACNKISILIKVAAIHSIKLSYIMLATIKYSISKLYHMVGMISGQFARS